MLPSSLSEAPLLGIAIIFVALACIRWDRFSSGGESLIAISHVRAYLGFHALWYFSYFLRNNSSAEVWGNISDVSLVGACVVAILMFRHMGKSEIDRWSCVLIAASLICVGVLGTIWTSERLDLHFDNLGALFLLWEVIRAIRSYADRLRKNTTVALLYGFIFFIGLLFLRSPLYELNPELFVAYHQTYSNFVLASMGLTLTFFLLSSLVMHSQEILERMAYQDGLTNTHNRRSLTRAYDALITECERHSRSYGMIVCDIDQFKGVNDKYGHDVGDQLIVNCARTLEQCVRPYDIVARIGGEEFVLLLKDCSRENLMSVSERVLKDVTAQRCSPAHPDLVYSLSIGGVHLQQPISFDAAFRLADRNLYQAKSSGRAQAVVSNVDEYTSDPIDRLVIKFERGVDSGTVTTVANAGAPGHPELLRRSAR